MKITLISPYAEISSQGVRALSAYVKRAGHQAQVIYLRGGVNALVYQKNLVMHYEESVIEDVKRICGDSGLIGISLMTNHFDRAVQLTHELKKSLQAPIIWGGVHPTARPEECLEHADMICTGEGEDSLLELMETLEADKDPSRIRNIWLKRNGDIIRNPFGHLRQDLDNLPYLDYDLEGHFIRSGDRVVPMTDELLKRYAPIFQDRGENWHPAYRTMTTRGCPLRCAYCFNSTYVEAYSGEKYLRRRSIEKVVDELKRIKERYPLFKIMKFDDDSFIARSDQLIKEFAEIYKKEVGLPFHFNTLASTVSEKKMEYLVDAGLVQVRLGIQSGSKRTQKIYKRPISNESILKAAHIMNRHKKVILPPYFDIILDSPFETEEDVIETLDLVSKLPQPFRLCLFSLTFFPETDLYKIAKEKGLIKDEMEEIYRKSFGGVNRFSYLNSLFYCYQYKHNFLPRPIMRVLFDRRTVKIVNGLRTAWLCGKFYEAARFIYHKGLALRNFLHLAPVERSIQD